MLKILEFDSKQEKYTFYIVMVLLVIAAGATIYPFISSYIKDNPITGRAYSPPAKLAITSPQDYYQMFTCPCCGKSIDSNCCGSAQERKAYVDKLISEGLEKDEIIYQMVKKFGINVLKDKSMEQDVKNYIAKNAPENPPKIDVDKESYDFGTVSQKDGIVSTTFEIKNNGKSELVIDNMETSCMCTSATLIYNGKESPEFGMSMHGTNPKDYELKLPPGDSAQLKVYYDPMAHGIQTKPKENIIREITLSSNDPIDFQKTVRIELVQVP